jgi:hypothetical protein
MALLNLADSRFQEGLMQEAKRAGKLRASYRIPTQFRNNLPEAYVAPLQSMRKRGLFPEYPFGSDLNEDERALKSALERIANAVKRPRAALGLAYGAVKLRPPSGDENRLLERMQLARPSSATDKLYRQLLLSALREIEAGGGDAH